MAYSKNRVDKAGKLFAEEIRVAVAKAKSKRDQGEIEAAIKVIDWFKRVPTIAGKLLREPSMKLSRMEDVGGVRAVLLTQNDAYQVASRLKRNWTITRFRDYVATPKTDGYRALHLTNRNRGRLVEIQLRTIRQDEWANAVEGASRRFPGLKFGGGPPVLRQFFEASAKLYAMLDGSLELDMSLLPELEELSVRADTFREEPFDEP